MSFAFSCQKHAKSTQNSHASEKLARILKDRLHYISLSRLGTQLLVIFLVKNVPPSFRDLEVIICIILTPDQDATIQ